jgi:hypothetical protein
MTKADQLFLISCSLWKMVYRLIQSTLIFLRLSTKYGISCFWSNWLSLFPRIGASYFAHTSPAEHNELGSEAAFRKRSRVPQGSHLGSLCFIWFANDIAQIFKCVTVFFMQMTWNCISLWVVHRINVNKCKTVTFTRSFHPFIASYVLNGKILECVFYDRFGSHLGQQTLF